MFGLNGIFHKGKSLLPNPAPNLKLVFKKGEVEKIKDIKGWRTDGQMAQALGITRAYVTMLANRRVSASHNVILRLAYLLGNLKSNWWVHYEVIDTGEPIDPDHPLWNEEKYQGRIPYGRFSLNADRRKKDYPVEVRSYAQEFPRGLRNKKRVDKIKI
jgi:transcriptional regulator with XRE-family HTH domain